MKLRKHVATCARPIGGVTLLLTMSVTHAAVVLAVSSRASPKEHAV